MLDISSICAQTLFQMFLKHFRSSTNIGFTCCFGAHVTFFFDKTNIALEAPKGFLMIHVKSIKELYLNKNLNLIRVVYIVENFT